jgi:hypothetical protein
LRIVKPCFTFSAQILFSSGVIFGQKYLFPENLPKNYHLAPLPGPPVRAAHATRRAGLRPP